MHLWYMIHDTWCILDDGWCMVHDGCCRCRMIDYVWSMKGDIYWITGWQDGWQRRMTDEESWIANDAGLYFIEFFFNIDLDGYYIIKAKKGSLRPKYIFFNVELTPTLISL